MGFTPNVICKETESVFNRSSIPGFNLVCDTYSPQGVPSKYNCTYKIPSINYPEKGDLAIYVDDESITLLQFPEADTIESYTFSDFHTIDPARIVFESIEDMNEKYAKEDQTIKIDLKREGISMVKTHLTKCQSMEYHHFT